MKTSDCPVRLGPGVSLSVAIASIALAVSLAQVAPIAQTNAPLFPDLVPLPTDFGSEGIAVGRGATFYVGSAAPPSLGHILSLNEVNAGAQRPRNRDLPVIDGDAQRVSEPTDDSTSQNGAVHALFSLHRPETGPFPSDIFTVADRAHNTGRRVNLPYPDCAVHLSECEDLDVINTLDGFGLQTRLSIPFDGPIDVNTATSKTVFLISLGSTVRREEREAGELVGINQIVWDTFTQTLHVESDELLTQHTRYALIVTNGLQDLAGRAVEASEAFRRFRQTVRGKYQQALLEAIHAARRLGVRERDIVVASVYTTQSITSVMERIRDEVKAATPAPANFLLGPNGERAVFNLADVTSIVWNQHTRVSPPGFTTVPIDLAILRYIPNAVGAIAYGRYASPEYRVPGEYIPAVGTLTGTPPVQSYNELYFTLFLPSGPRPPTGWPVAIVGHGTVENRHNFPGLVAAMLASHGIATIGINVAGNGFGPLGTLAIRLTNGSSLVIPDVGRGIDQNGDNTIGVTEGSSAAAPRTWTIGVRDSNRQTAIDLMQLVRVIEVGMDVDGDGSPDLDPNRIFYFGNSGGAMYGAVFLALEPSIYAAAEGVPGGMSPEHARWRPGGRPGLGNMLGTRTPSLLNSPGITEIDGVAVNPPHFNENKPLRNQPPVTNAVEGAIDIQNAMELHEWGQQLGQSPVIWARYLHEAPLPGLFPKSLLILFAKGDQNSINPATTAVLRAGNLADRTVHYRHDLAFAEDPTIPTTPHSFIILPTHPNALVRSIAQGVQRQIATFFASDGTVVIYPEPARFFEVPVVGPLPEALNYIR
jgi:Bacterial virulence factor lipase N-terminal